MGRFTPGQKCLVLPVVSLCSESRDVFFGILLDCLSDDRNLSLVSEI